jgi:hypothetical protein
VSCTERFVGNLKRLPIVQRTEIGVSLPHMVNFLHTAFSGLFITHALDLWDQLSHQAHSGDQWARIDDLVQRAADSHESGFAAVMCPKGSYLAHCAEYCQSATFPRRILDW